MRVLVVGTGRIALSHLPHMFINMQVEVVGLVEPNFIMRQVISRLVKIRIFKSLDAIGDLKFDAAIILTPPGTHYVLAKRMLMLGKHVFVEKPLTLDPQDSEDLVGIAKRNHVVLCIGYVYRFALTFAHLKDLLAKKEFGDVLSSKVRMIGSVVNGSQPATWRNSGVGAGCLYDYGCHAIDLSLFILGPVDATSCIGKDELFSPGVVDRFSARFEHAGDHNIVSEIFCDWADQSVRKATLEIEIVTVTHKIVADSQRIQVSGESTKNILVRDLDTDVDFYLRGEEFQRQLDNFIKLVGLDKIDYSAASDAAQVDHIIRQLDEAVL